MNQRIQELAQQAGFVFWDTEHWKPKGQQIDWSMDYDVELEKFAQLIALRCAEICMEMSAKCAGLPGEGALAKDCAFWINKDFGVEP